jgi:hypothetical protein
MESRAGHFSGRIRCNLASGSHTVSDAQSQYWINNCRLLELILTGVLSPAQTGFSVVTLLKMSARLIMTGR